MTQSVKRALFVYGGLLLSGLVLAVGHSAYEPVAPREHRRGEEQTFLTYPEWFLVFSPDEYAQYVKHAPPSGFPFWGHIRQFWGSYAAVIREQRAHPDYPPNTGYHVMINVIGVSTTIEYGLRSAYETFVGRLTELTASTLTAEDAYGARVAQEYVDFIKIRPWYEFDFTSKLATLWSDTPLAGRHMLRKWERRYALTTEYLVKGGYGWLLGKATHASYERPLTVTHVAYREGSGALATTLVPRYGEFTPAATRLAIGGANFVEIAGNGDSAAILVSVLAPQDWHPPAATHLLFEQPLLTMPGRKRVALSVAVGTLASVLRQLSASPVEIEHVFDY